MPWPRIIGTAGRGDNRTKPLSVDKSFVKTFDHYSDDEKKRLWKQSEKRRFMQSAVLAMIRAGKEHGIVRKAEQLYEEIEMICQENNEE